jgi:hypothetical protein
LVLISAEAYVSGDATLARMPCCVASRYVLAKCQARVFAMTRIVRETRLFTLGLLAWLGHCGVFPGRDIDEQG